MEPIEREIAYLELPNGKLAYQEWIDGIKDMSTRSRIKARVARMAKGNFGDYKQLNEKLYELRMTFGPGYRVYFAFEGNTLIILIGGGDKSSQANDINKANQLLEDYKNEISTIRRG